MVIGFIFKHKLFLLFFIFFGGGGGEERNGGHHFYVFMSIVDLEDDSLTSMKVVWIKARQAFDSGIEVFEAAEDVANQALLHCNYGRLMRLIAQTYTNVTMKGAQEFTALEREFYNKVSCSNV